MAASGPRAGPSKFLSSAGSCVSPATCSLKISNILPDAQEFLRRRHLPPRFVFPGILPHPHRPRRTLPGRRVSPRRAHRPPHRPCRPPRLLRIFPPRPILDLQPAPAHPASRHPLPRHERPQNPPRLPPHGAPADMIVTALGEAVPPPAIPLHTSPHEQHAPQNPARTAHALAGHRHALPRPTHRHRHPHHRPRSSLWTSTTAISPARPSSNSWPNSARRRLQHESRQP